MTEIKSRKFSEIKNFASLIGIAGFMLLSVIYSLDIKQGISESLSVCLSVIIPSMYGFMFICSFLIGSNIYRYLGKPFRFVAHYVFRMTEYEFTIYVLSIFGGYPIGVKMLYELAYQGVIDEKRADRLAGFCFASGPAFISGTVSSEIFGNLQIGIYIFAVLTAANMIIAIISGLLSSDDTVLKDSKISSEKIKINSSVFIKSAESAAISIFKICVMIICFSYIYQIIKSVGLIDAISNRFSNPDLFRNIAAAIFEISKITSFEPLNFNNIPIICALLSFGGLCVLMQLAAISGGKLKILRFLTVRIAAAIVSYLLCAATYKSVIRSLVIDTLSPFMLKSNEASAIPSVLLFIMTVLLLSEKVKSD